MNLIVTEADSRDG